MLQMLREKISLREKRSVDKARYRFRRPRNNVEGSKLLVDGILTTDAKVLLDEWVRHFESLAECRSGKFLV